MLHVGKVSGHTLDKWLPSRELQASYPDQAHKRAKQFTGNTSKPSTVVIKKILLEFLYTIWGVLALWPNTVDYNCILLEKWVSQREALGPKTITCEPLSQVNFKCNFQKLHIYTGNKKSKLLFHYNENTWWSLPSEKINKVKKVVLPEPNIVKGCVTLRICLLWWTTGTNKAVDSEYPSPLYEDFLYIVRNVQEKYVQLIKINLSKTNCLNIYRTSIMQLSEIALGNTIHQGAIQRKHGPSQNN